MASQCVKRHLNCGMARASIEIEGKRKSEAERGSEIALWPHLPKWHFASAVASAADSIFSSSGYASGGGGKCAELADSIIIRSHKECIFVIN